MPVLPEHKEILLSQCGSKTLPMNYSIYMHINKINGKKYVGQTKQVLKQHWKNGLGYIEEQPYFYKAIKKYGWNNFEHILLETNINTLEEANEREKYWITFYDAKNPEKGYNLTDGGVDEAQLERAHAGWRKWRQENPEQFMQNVKKMQQARIKQCSIPVYNKELNQVFYSAGKASRATGVNQSNITKCCKGKYKTAGGYHGSYANQ